MSKHIKEVKDYLIAEQNLAKVSKGGKDYASCSFMDIAIRIERKDIAKDIAIKALGIIALEKLLKNNK